MAKPTRKLPDKGAKLDAAIDQSRQGDDGADETALAQITGTGGAIAAFDPRNFADDLLDGAEIGEKFLKMESGFMFTGWLVGRSWGRVDDIETGKPKPILKYHFELSDANDKYTSLGFRVILFSAAQLDDQLKGIPDDGSCWLRIGKGGTVKTKNGRNVGEWFFTKKRAQRDPTGTATSKESLAEERAQVVREIAEDTAS